MCHLYAFPFFVRVTRICIRVCVIYAVALVQISFVPRVPQCCMVHVVFPGSFSESELLEARDRAQSSTGITVFGALRAHKGSQAYWESTKSTSSGECHIGEDAAGFIDLNAGLQEEEEELRGDASVVSCCVFEWKMGPQNAQLPEELFVEGWKAFAKHLREVKRETL